MSSALADRDVFQSLAPPPAAVAELKAEEHANICRELGRSVLAYLREEGSIEQRRCFLLRPETSWNSMEKFIQNELASQGGKRLAFDWHDPGIDLVAVWKIGRFGAGRIAVAMSPTPVDGQSLVGYFNLP
jgi:hypothetical protein